MNIAELILCVLCGFAVPSAIAPIARTSVYATAERWSGNDRSALLVQWMFAFVCGPAAFASSLVKSRAESRETGFDLMLGMLAATGWAALYGYVLLSLAKALVV